MIDAELGTQYAGRKRLGTVGLRGGRRLPGRSLDGGGDLGVLRQVVLMAPMVITSAGRAWVS